LLILKQALTVSLIWRTVGRLKHHLLHKADCIKGKTSSLEVRYELLKQSAEKSARVLARVTSNFRGDDVSKLLDELLFVFATTR